MAKTNYSKVEVILSEGLRKLLAKSLLAEADQAQGAPPPVRLEGMEVIISLKKEIDFLKNRDTELYKHLGISPKKIKILMEQSHDLSENELELARNFLNRVQAYKKEFLEKNPEPTDEQLIEKELKRHLNKRHNVNEKWLPLD